MRSASDLVFEQLLLELRNQGLEHHLVTQIDGLRRQGKIIGWRGGKAFTKDVFLNQLENLSLASVNSRLGPASAGRNSGAKFMTFSRFAFCWIKVPFMRSSKTVIPRCISGDNQAWALNTPVPRARMMPIGSSIADILLTTVSMK